MLSSFLKKLLFARQFYMVDGKIEVLGKRQVMLPSNVLAVLGQNGLRTDIIKSVVLSDFQQYAQMVGSSEEGMFKNIHNIFETFGLGRLEIADLDNANKRCVVRVHDSPFEKANLTPVVLSGMFSFLFKKDVNAVYKDVKFGFEEFVIE
ncbi:hypothetical protein KY320_02210 [Candidatus Woesearchaeota archaeon]|nr:hypothetical protein [Candidatus Woesearchaeota archaeon]